MAAPFVAAAPAAYAAPLAYTAASPYLAHQRYVSAQFAAPFAYNAPLIRQANYVAAAPAPLVAAHAAPFVATAPAAPLVAAAQAAPLVATHPVLARTELDDAYPQYQYAYNVHDSLTGDSKTQEESRDGDIVKGSYSLIEPDGSRRIVNYYADPINGFNAVVQKELPVAGVAPVFAAKQVVAAPAVVPAKTIVAV